MLIKLTRLKLVHKFTSFLHDSIIVTVSLDHLFDESLALFILVDQASDVGLHLGLHELSAFDVLREHLNFGVLKGHRRLFRHQFLLDLRQSLLVSLCGPPQYKFLLL